MDYKTYLVAKEQFIKLIVKVIKRALSSGMNGKIILERKYIIFLYQLFL